MSRKKPAGLRRCSRAAREAIELFKDADKYLTMSCLASSSKPDRHPSPDDIDRDDVQETDELAFDWVSDGSNEIFRVGITHDAPDCGSGKLLTLQAGDDGFWWDIATYDSAWIDELIRALRSAKAALKERK